MSDLPFGPDLNTPGKVVAASLMFDGLHDELTGAELREKCELIGSRVEQLVEAQIHERLLLRVYDRWDRPKGDGSLEDTMHKAMTDKDQVQNAHTWLDNRDVPRGEYEGDNRYTIVGRLQVWWEKLGHPAP